MPNIPIFVMLLSLQTIATVEINIEYDGTRYLWEEFFDITIQYHKETDIPTFFEITKA